VFSPLDPVDLLGDYFSSDFNSSRVLGFHTHGSPFVSSIWMAAVEKGRRGWGKELQTWKCGLEGAGAAFLTGHVAVAAWADRRVPARSVSSPRFCFGKGASPTCLLILGCRN
jgi:hypothetical protein